MRKILFLILLVLEASQLFAQGLTLLAPEEYAKLPMALTPLSN